MLFSPLAVKSHRQKKRKRPMSFALCCAIPASDDYVRCSSSTCHTRRTQRPFNDLPCTLLILCQRFTDAHDRACASRLTSWNASACFAPVCGEKEPVRSICKLTCATAPARQMLLESITQLWRALQRECLARIWRQSWSYTRFPVSTLSRVCYSWDRLCLA
jgi:hypothetical protein